MKRTTKLRLAAVRKFAEWLRIPVTIHDEMLPEVLHNNIDRYINESAVLLCEVWRAPDAERDFRRWARNFLTENMHNPFNLHEHPLYFAGLYLGHDQLGPEGKMADERFREFSQTPAYAEMFRRGWRVNFGMWEHHAA